MQDLNLITLFYFVLLIISLTKADNEKNLNQNESSQLIDVNQMLEYMNSDALILKKSIEKLFEANLPEIQDTLKEKPTHSLNEQQFGKFLIKYLSEYTQQAMKYLESSYEKDKVRQILLKNTKICLNKDEIQDINFLKDMYTPLEILDQYNKLMEKCKLNYDL